MSNLAQWYHRVTGATTLKRLSRRLPHIAALEEPIRALSDAQLAERHIVFDEDEDYVRRLEALALEFVDEPRGGDVEYGMYLAVFGTGDQIGYPDTFVDAIEMVAERMRNTGARLVGRWPADGSSFAASRAAVGGIELLGLAIDEDNEPDLTAGRVAGWAAQIAREAGLRTRVSI